MAQQVKRDINKKGGEESDFPSVCETCLGPNPYIRMLKQKHGAECKICSRPFTVFRWPIQGQSKYQKTAICNTCCRIRNCCSLCMLDLQFGLPIQIRDAALKLVKQGPSSEINREYYAQNQAGLVEAGEVPSAYGKADHAARDLLKKLARSEPYYKRQKVMEQEPSYVSSLSSDVPRPLEERGGGGTAAPFGGRPPTVTDAMPPADKRITSLFLMGIEDDLPEHAIRQFFQPYGPVKSLVVSHRSKCGFITFVNRSSAERAARECAGEGVVRGCPLRIQWGKVRSLGGFQTEQQNAALVKLAMANPLKKDGMGAGIGSGNGEGGRVEDYIPAPPPGASRVVYSSQAGEQ